MLHYNTQRQRQLRHPNVMTATERLALPDPCRPIDERVIPARHTIELYMQKPVTQADSKNHSFSRDSFDERPKNSLAADKTTKPAKKSSLSHESDMVDRLVSDQAIDISQFIKQQQQLVNNKQSKQQLLQLPLSLLPRLVNDSSIALMKQVISHYPHLAIMNTLPPSMSLQTRLGLPQTATTHAQKHAQTLSINSDSAFDHPNQTSAKPTPANQAINGYPQALLDIEAKLYLMGQMYHIVLCLFLLCQCKSRKSLNPQITLQDLADSINQYIDAHRTELYFLTQHETLHIEATHIELAAIAMDWQVGKQANISERTTTISSHNPLTAG